MPGNHAKTPHAPGRIQTHTLLVSLTCHLPRPTVSPVSHSPGRTQPTLPPLTVFQTHTLTKVAEYGSQSSATTNTHSTPLHTSAQVNGSGTGLNTRAEGKILEAHMSVALGAQCQRCLYNALRTTRYSPDMDLAYPCRQTIPAARQEGTVRGELGSLGAPPQPVRE